MKEFSIPYSEWDKIPWKADGRRIGYVEMLDYMGEQQNIFDEKKAEAEDEAENKMRDVKGGHHDVLGAYGKRKMVTAQSDVE